MTSTITQTKHNAIGESTSDRIFNLVLIILVFFILLIVMYPLYFIVVASFTDPLVVSTGKILLYPEKFTVLGYKSILSNYRIWSGYGNTIFYVGIGTPAALAVTIPAAYSLSRKDLPGRNIIMGIFLFTMYFGGGLIPTYMTVKNLGLINNPLVIIILGSFSVYNMIIARSFFSNTIPQEIHDAAAIDGCSNQSLFFRIILPLSKPIIAVITLYCAVSHWNAFFNALIYLTDNKYYPLQLVLRSILLEASALSEQSVADAGSHQAAQQLAEIIKYGVIVVSTAPIIALYPFVQKYFVQGVMIGSVKG